MSPHYKAFIVVMILGAFIAFLARPLLSPSQIPPKDWNFRVTLCAILLVLGFLLPNFWLFALLATVVLAVAVNREPNALAVYVLALMVVPPFSQTIPGFGIVDQLFLLTNTRLVTLAFAIPLAFKLRQQAASRSGLPRVGDWLVALFVLYRIAVSLPHLVSGTNMLREVFLSIVDLWVPYYVASRSIRNRDQLRDFLGTLVAVGAFLGLLAMFETARRWQLFDFENHMGMRNSARGYLSRETGGPLRAVVTGGHPIVLGTFLMMLVPLYLAIHASLPKGIRRLGLLLPILGGLIASLSRGPWIATVFATLVYFVLSARLSRAIPQILMFAVGVIGLLVATPLGDLILPYLPFVGTRAQSGTVDYRVELFRVSMEVFREHPWLGDPAYLGNPKMEVMRQGEGIIDIVNSYLQLLLSYGVLGAVLFIGSVLVAMRHVTRNRSSLAPAAVRLNAGLCAAFAGLMLSIVSMSQIHTIPYWIAILTGVCLGPWVTSAALQPAEELAPVAPRAPASRRSWMGTGRRAPGSALRPRGVRRI